MEHKSVTHYGESLANISILIDNPLKEKFITEIINKISFYDDIGFAGFKDRNSLEEFLIWMIFSNSKTDTWKSVNIKECKREIDLVLRKCSKVIQNRKINIFIFPTISKFVVENMGGVSGFTPWKNTILIGIYRTKDWKEALRATLVHELAHALQLNFSKRKTLGDDLVFEGIAEHFREDFLNGQSPWVKSISEEKAKQIFLEIKPMLKKRSNELYQALFFGTSKYPLWSGYAIGYYLVKAYMDKYKKKDWKRILQVPPSEIIRESNYLTL